MRDLLVFVLAVFDVAVFVAVIFFVVVLVLCFVFDVLTGVEVLATFFVAVFFGADLIVRVPRVLVVFRVVFLLA